MRKKKTVNQILSYCILAIILLIIFGTFVVFVVNLFSFSNQKNEARTISSNEEIVLAVDSQEIYRKIGRIRSATKDGIPIVISVYFPFPKDDIDFYEELSIKNESLKSEIVRYFTNYSYDELKIKNENSIKREVINQLNEKLVLNKIETIYFEEFIFFD